MDKEPAKETKATGLKKCGECDCKRDDSIPGSPIICKSIVEPVIVLDPDI